MIPYRRCVRVPDALHLDPPRTTLGHKPQQEVRYHMAQPAEEAARPAALARGLSSAEAAERLRRDGYNELPYERRRSVFAIAFAILREPMLLLLVAATVLYLVLGDLQEAIILVASLAVVIGITLYQEHKTERALDALRDLSSPRASVIRDGQARRIAG